jgi:hypothetical protein
LRPSCWCITEIEQAHNSAQDALPAGYLLDLPLVAR